MKGLFRQKSPNIDCHISLVLDAVAKLGIYIVETGQIAFLKTTLTAEESFTCTFCNIIYVKIYQIPLASQ